jgi:hypothetical protein
MCTGSLRVASLVMMEADLWNLGYTKKIWSTFSSQVDIHPIIISSRFSAISESYCILNLLGKTSVQVGYCSNPTWRSLDQRLAWAYFAIYQNGRIAAQLSSVGPISTLSLEKMLTMLTSYWVGVGESDFWFNFTTEGLD